MRNNHRTRTMQKILMTCACIACVGAICFETSRFVQATAAPAAAQQALAPNTAAPAPPATPARQLVTTYCITCHNERTKTGGLVLFFFYVKRLPHSSQPFPKAILFL